MRKLLTFLIVSFCMNNIYLQDNLGMINVNVSKQEISNIELAPKYSKNVGNKEGILMHLPNLEGNMSEYRFFKNDFLSQEMQINYPEITTYTGYSVSNKSEFINIVKHGDKINGILMGHSSYHLFEIDNGQYSLKDSQDDQLHQKVTGECGTDHTNFRPFLPTGQRSNYLNVKLRKFRLAIVITDEFVLATNGGNNAIAAATLIVSNLNAFYKKELAIEFIPNVKPEIPSMPINPSNSAVKGGQVISQYFTLSEYDIGHVFHKITNNQIGSQGQVFGIGTVCNSAGNPPLKASGWTEGNVPISTSFLGVLIHEIAHMFGATHTFNGTASYPLNPSIGCLNNQRSPLTSFEPGAGTTLMSYSGVCGSHNIKLPNNSDAPRSSYFHAGSIDQILAFLENNPNVCGIPETLSNSPPLITSITTGLPLPIRLPKSTPFELKGQAIDPDGDNLTYCWEQMDPGPPHGAVNIACGSSNGPIFRSYDPSSNPSRLFPDLQYILKDNNTPASNIGECLPSVSRNTLNFRLTVRDNNPQGGGIAFDDILIKIDGNIGPMLVTAPNTPVNWNGGSKDTVSWSVNRTDEICSTVNILLSVDGGFTFPYRLANDIPNSGLAEVTIPESIPQTNTARIKVESSCSEFIKFFDFSNSNFNLNTQCSILSKFGICNDKPVVVTEGSESLSLNLSQEINRINTSPTLSTTGPRGSFPINLEPAAGPGACRLLEANYYSQKFEFVINKSGVYVFDIMGTGTISIFKNLYNADSPCDNYLGSNSYYDNLGRFFRSQRLTIELNAECSTYTLMFFTQSIVNNRNMTVSGPGGSLVLTPQMVPLDFDLTYMAVDSLSQVIKAFNPTGNFITLNPGSYKVYGLYYFAGAALLPQKIELNALINKKLTEVLSFNSCFSISQNHKPLKVLPLCSRTIEIPDIAGINQLCPGQSTTLTASGGVSYIWSTQERTISINVSPVVTTTYIVTVTDAEGCSASKNIRVTFNPNPVPVITGTDNICYNTATVLDAGQGYVSYNWSDGGGTDRLSTFNELKSEKTITVTVTDANQCQGTASIDIKVRQPVIPVIIGNENLCRGDEVTLYTTLPFAQYSWSNNGGSQSAALYTDVASGEQYSVTVTDMFGCFGIATVTIDAFTGLNVVLSTENTSCGLDNGSATASIGAQGNYTFQWDTQQTSGHITGLSAGMYTVTVTDDKACSGTATAIIAPSDIITLNPEVAHTSCGLSDGSARIVAEGGTGFRYFWNDGNVSSFRENMAPGSYTVTVTATGDCTAVSDVFIEDSQGLTLSAEVDHTTCGEANGSITIIATGGDSYDYQWNTGDSMPMLIGLPDGDYSVTVTDQRKCFALIEKTVLPSLPLQVEISGPEAVCEGGTATVSVPEGLSYEWSTGATGSAIQVSPGEYSVTVTDLTGCSTVAYKSIQTLLVPAPDILGADGACNNKMVTLSVQEGANIVWSTGQNTQSIEVLSGTYSVTVEDLNGCSSVATKIVNAFPDPRVAIDGEEGVCDGSLLTITASAGLDYSWNTGASTAQIQVDAGKYTVTVTDSNGCSASTSKVVNILIKPLAGIAGNVQVCLDKTTTLTAHGGINYLWNTQQTNKVIQAGQGTYSVTVTDINGCTDASSRLVTLYPATHASIEGNEGVCAGGLTKLTATGGIKFLWNNGSAAQFVDIPAGPYSVIVTDKNNCTAIATKTVISNPQVTVQSSEISFNAVSQNQITLRWKPGNGAKRLVVAKAFYPVTGLPINGINYQARQDFGQGSSIAPNEYVVYNGDLNEVTVTQLAENTTYYFRLFEAGCQNNYLSGIAFRNPAAQKTECAAPISQAQNVSFSAVGTQQMTVNWSKGNGSRRVVKLNTTNQFNPPASGTNPIAQDKYNNNGEQVVYNGSGSTVVIKGLVPGTTYWVRIYEANCEGNRTVYNKTIASANPVSQKTLTVLPYFQSLTVSDLIGFGSSQTWIPMYNNTNLYGINPPIILNATGLKTTRFAIQSSDVSKLSIQLTDKVGRIVTDENIRYNPDRYGTFEPFTYALTGRFEAEYTNPSMLDEQPYTSLRLHILYDGGLTGLSVPVHIYKAESAALPIILKDLTATWLKSENMILVEWTTSSEVNNNYFTVERNFENKGFEQIGKVNGASNSTEITDYKFPDYDIEIDGYYIYRIQQEDFNGRQTYFWPVSVLVSKDKTVKTSLYPNPSSGLIHLQVEAYEGAMVRIDIFNALGQSMKTGLNQEILSDRNMTYEVDGGTLIEGLYSVIITIDGERYKHKLIVMK